MRSFIYKFILISSCLCPVATVSNVACAAQQHNSVEIPPLAPQRKTAMVNVLTSTDMINRKKAPEPSLSSADWQRYLIELRGMHLLVPLEGYNPQHMKGSFYEARAGQMHEAVDMLAPRFTPIHAVCDGRIAKLFQSRLGGTTIYQFDPLDRFVFYYAHLQNYAEGLTEGETVKKGEVIGYVGTSGNAPPNTPHLHFSISVLGPLKQWWRALPIDPYEVFTGGVPKPRD